MARDISSTKPTGPIKTEEFFSPKVVFGFVRFLVVLLGEDESLSKDKVVKRKKIRNMGSKMKIKEIVKKRYASKRYLFKPNTRYTTPNVELDAE